MPKLTIDGKEVEVEPGTTVIRAAEKAGIFIPRYCWHPGLTIAGNCRMCLVEIEKMPKLVISCSTQIAEGMVVRTTSPKVKEAQDAVLEFLLINHPLDCPICDQAGECKLQEFAYDYGPAAAASSRTRRTSRRPWTSAGTSSSTASGASSARAACASAARSRRRAS
jgi:NADH-quinone oxidoreductase subunit G